MTTQTELLAQLDGWMKEKEGENQEFKAATGGFHFDKLVEYCCAIANEGGGRVILGVSDQRPRKVVGTKAFDQPERTRKGLCDRIPLRIDFSEIAHPDGRVLVVHIPPRPVGTPIMQNGVAWVRKEDSLVPMTPDRLRAIFAEAGHDFSADICAGATMGDLVQSSIEDFRKRWMEKTRRAGNPSAADRLKALPHEQLLADAELIDGGKPTYAAMVLFGSRKALGKHLAQAEVVWEYRSTEASGPAQAREEFREGFFGFYEKLWEAINVRNDQQSYQDGLYVLTIPTFNERAVREAILNAVSHRDYQLGGNVFVRQFPRRLEIDSPGGFPVGITVENVIDRQNPRNRRIADTFTKCGLVERSGQGMNLMFEESIRESKPLPEFTRTDQYQVGLTLHGNMQNPNLIRFLEQVGNQTTARFTTRDWLILDLVTRNEKIPKEYDGRLKHLLELGIVERAGGRRCILGQKYYTFAGQAPAYTRQKGLGREENLALLLSHITKNAKLGSPFQDLAQVLPSLSEDSIQSLLRTLKQRAQAHAVGKTKAGRWFPGPAPSANPPVGG